MDDLRTLREWRAEIPEPDQEWTIPHRRRLLARIRRHRRNLPLRLLLVGPLVGAVGAAAALVAVTVRPEPPTAPSATPSAVVRLDPGLVLARAAEVAGRRGDVPLPEPTQWHYTKTLDKQPNSDTTETREGWLRYDGKQSAGYDENGKLVISDVPPDPGDDDLSPQQYDAKLRDLPTDPRKLLAKVTGDRHWLDFPREEGVPKHVEPADARAYRVIMIYLSSYGTMPPRLEAAMFRALALIPGVRIEPGVTDAAGRAGLGIWREVPGDPAARRYRVLDQDTYRYLGEKTIWLRDEHPQFDSEHVVREDSGPAFRKGSVFATALLTSAIVDRPGQRS